MKVKIKHIDGVTDVIAKVFISSDGVSLDYRFEGMDYSQILDYEQTVRMGIVKCNHPTMNPILGFENSQIGEVCNICNKEIMFSKTQP